MKRIKPCLAWALIDPMDRQILPRRIFDEPVDNGGRGSVTDGWVRIRVKIIPAGRQSKKRK